MPGRTIIRARYMQGFRGELGAEEAIGRYRIVLPLGQGGTADVYLAVADGPSGFHKLVVLKALRKCFSDDPDFRAMFLSEARLAARLHHPNIVQTNEVVEVDGVPTLVMEYLDGQPLSQVIVRGKQGGFSLSMQLRVIIDAAWRLMLGLPFGDALIRSIVWMGGIVAVFAPLAIARYRRRV